MTLSAGRAELHARLNAAAFEGKAWARRELALLLRQARDAVVKCPHEGCAYCWNAEQEAR